MTSVPAFRLPALSAVVWTAALSLIGFLAVYSGPGRQLAPVLVGAAIAWRFAARRPVLTVAGLVLLSGTWGSLLAYGLPIPRYAVPVIATAGLALAAGAWLAGGRERERISVWPPVVGLGLYVALSALSVPLSPDTTLALESFMRAFTPVILFVVLAVTPWPSVVRERIAEMLLAAIGFVALYATLRYITGPSATEAAAVRSQTLDVGGGEIALFGSFSNRQELGGWMAVGLPITIALGLSWSGRWRWLAAASALGGFIALIGCNTRIALVAGIVGAALALLLQLASRARMGRLGLIASTVIGVLVAGIVTFSLTVDGGEKADRYSRLLTPNQDVQLSQRREKWKVAISETNDKPFGNGLGTAGGAQQEAGRFQSIETSSIDNSYLTLAYQQGFIAVAVFVGLLLAVLFQVMKAGLATTDPRKAGVAAGAVGGMAAWLVLLSAGNYLERWDAIPAFVALGLAAGWFTTQRERA